MAVCCVTLRMVLNNPLTLTLSHRKEKAHVNVVVIGHVDSGKSTTTGHLIYKVCRIRFSDLGGFSLIMVFTTTVWWYRQTYH